MYEKEVMMIPFRTFKEKIAITKKYFYKAKMEIIDNRFVYIEMRDKHDKN